MTTPFLQLSQQERLSNFEAHAAAMDRATESSRPHSYIFSNGKHVTINEMPAAEKMVAIRNGRGEIKGYIKVYWCQSLGGYVTIPERD